MTSTDPERMALVAFMDQLKAGARDSIEETKRMATQAGATWDDETAKWTASLFYAAAGDPKDGFPPEFHLEAITVIAATILTTT